MVSTQEPNLRVIEQDLEVDERGSKRARIENDLQKEELTKVSRLAKCGMEVVRLAEEIQLAQSMIDQVQANLEIIYNSSAHTREISLIAAATLYITLRLNNMPFTLMNIADKVPCDVFSLGKVYTRAMIANPNFCFSELDPSLFVEKKCKQLQATEVQQEDIQRLAMRILTVLKDKDILCGRRRETIAACSILFATQALGLKQFNSDTVSSALNVPKSTLGVRVREMKTALLALASKHIPWANFPVKDLHRHLNRILDQLETLSRVVSCPSNVVIVDDSDSDTEIFVPRVTPKTETVTDSELQTKASTPPIYPTYLPQTPTSSLPYPPAPTHPTYKAKFKPTTQRYNPEGKHAKKN